MNSTTHRRGRQQGFTIVEALLVGILLTVVVAIALPSSASPRMSNSKGQPSPSPQT